MTIPTVENLDKVLYEASSKPGALDMDSFHTCETSHCRAGWIIHLAGEAGYALEKQTDTVFAAMQIYRASTGRRISPCRFYDSNADALADMKRLAEAAI